MALQRSIAHRSLVLAAIVLSCGPEYRSGTTICASSGQACPDGFTCVSQRCYRQGEEPAGADGGPSPVAGMGGPLGTGGASGGGGMSGSGGMSGMGGNDTPGIGGMGGATVTCNDPERPNKCPARGGVPQICWRATTDCSTITACEASPMYRGCPAGHTVSCQYINFCTPQRCDDPMFPKLCPAGGGAGPGCYAADTDCTSVALCNGRVSACPGGYFTDCRFPNYCSPVDNKCMQPEFPVFCPARMGAGPSCYRPGTDCTTVRLCEGRVAACATGQMVDCTVTPSVCRQAVRPDGGGADAPRPPADAGPG